MYRVRQVRYALHRATIRSRAIVEVHEESRRTVAADIVTKVAMVVATVDRVARRKAPEAAEVEGIILRRVRAAADRVGAVVVVDRPAEVAAAIKVVVVDELPAAAVVVVINADADPQS